MIYDITRTICPGTAVWPGDPPVQLTALLSLAAGDLVNLAQLTMGTHTGTHVDAPRHICADGGTVEALSLSALVGPAMVLDFSACAEVSPRQLAASLPEGCQRLLLRTIPLSESGGMPSQWCAISPEAAASLVQRGILLVGVDAPSVDVADVGAGPVHRALLQAGVVVVEGLALEGITPGAYDLVCLPLKLRGGDGAPARAILIE
jgi:arylformamidase